MIDEGKRHQEACYSQTEAFYAGGHGFGSCQVGSGKGCDSVRRGQIGKDGIVKNEKMGCQDLYSEVSQGLCSDGNTNDISSRGWNAALCSRHSESKCYQNYFPWFKFALGLQIGVRSNSPKSSYLNLHSGHIG